MEENELIEEMKQLEAENNELRGELANKAMIATKSTNNTEYFTNINGVYAKDIDGRAETAELRTLIEGIDIGSYTTSERKIGKWIDGSDLYQRTFEVTGLHNDGTYDDNILGTSNVLIRDWTGYLQYDVGAGKQYFTVQGYGSGSGDWIGCWTTLGGNDLTIRAKLNAGIYALDKAVITIKYTKVSVQANVQQTEEPTDESR